MWMTATIDGDDREATEQEIAGATEQHRQESRDEQSGTGWIMLPSGCRAYWMD